MEDKLEKRDEKLLRGLNAGGKLVERSISKLAWDVVYGEVKVEAGKLDYRVHQVMNCASDIIARGGWVEMTFSKRIKECRSRSALFDVGTHKFPIVIIPFGIFKDFVGNQDLKTEEVIEIFKKVLRIALWGKTNIPIYDGDFKWGAMNLLGSHICDVAIASEDEDYGKYRSEKKLSGRGSKEKEPVFILIFSSTYGLTWFQNSMERKGTDLCDHLLHSLNPKAQELFQTVRWKKGMKNRLVIMTIEKASKAMNLKYPLKNKKNLPRRVDLIRRVLKILKDNMFINYNDEKYERGESWDKKTWNFYIRSGASIGIAEYGNRDRRVKK